MIQKNLFRRSEGNFLEVSRSSTSLTCYESVADSLAASLSGGQVHQTDEQHNSTADPLEKLATRQLIPERKHEQTPEIAPCGSQTGKVVAPPEIVFRWDE